MAAGRTLLATFAPGATLVRRVEKIEWIAPHEFQRRVSIVVDSRKGLHRATSQGLALDIQFLGLLPKGLLRDFDVTSASGESCALVDRHLDARAAQAFMMALAVKHASVTVPTEGVWRRLFVAAYRFPDHASPPMEPQLLEEWAKEVGREDLAKDDVAPLTAAELAWWDAASAHAGWAWWLRRIVVNFALFVHDPPSSSPRVFKYRWRDLNPSANLGPRKQRALARERSGLGYRIPLHDFGRASSEHTHVLAASETFLTGGVLTRGAGKVDVRSRATLRQQSFYFGPRPEPKRSPGRCHIHLRVLPMPRGLLEPLRTLAWYTGLLMTGLAFAQGVFNVAEHVTQSVDAVVALVLFAPSLLFPLLFRRDDHELRWMLLGGWRDLVFVLLLPVPITFVLLLSVPSGVAGRWVLTAFLVVISGYTWLMVMRLTHDARVVASAYKTVLAAEALPSKGQRARPGAAATP